MRKKRALPRGSQAGKAVSPKQKEVMLQLYAIEGNYTEVARRMKLSTNCVTRHLKAMLAQPDPEVAQARQRAARELAGKVHSTANRIIDSIGEQDIESGQIKLYDKEGKLTRVVNYGPSLMQKVTASAILTDKLKVLREVEIALGSESNENRMMLPQDVQNLVSGIQTKLKGLTFLNMRFEEDEPDISQRAQKVLEEAEVVEAVVEDVKLDDFDGN